MKEKIITLTLVLLLSAGAYYAFKRYQAGQYKTKELSMNYSTQMHDDRTITPSGLAYKIITPASDDAQKPQKGKIVTVHYTGWLNENDAPSSKFDSSVDRNQPFTFPLGIGMVIQGWDEAVADMKKGEKRRVYIPSSLGYGAHGAGAVIPPHADLIFDIELLDI